MTLRSRFRQEARRGGIAFNHARARSSDDILDLITVAVGNGYLLIIDATSRIDATDAAVRNAQALYDQAVEALASAQR